ncbi:hypothetical protein D3C72_1603000 [compost metagenome]
MRPSLRLQGSQQLLAALLHTLRIRCGKPVAEQAFTQLTPQFLLQFLNARLFQCRARLRHQIVRHAAAVAFIHGQQGGPTVAGLTDVALNGVVGAGFPFARRVERRDCPD